MGLTDDRIKRAIIWGGLGLSVPLPKGPDSEKEKLKVQVQDDWELIKSRLSTDSELRRKIAELLVDPLREIIEWGLTRSQSVSKARPAIREQWKGLNDYLKKQGELPRMMAHKAAPLLEILNSAQPPPPSATTPRPQPADASAVGAAPPTRPFNDPAQTTAASGQPESAAVEKPTSLSDLEETEETMPAKSDENKAGANAPPAAADPKLDPVTNSKPPAPQWKWLPVPKSEPDEHEESDSRSAKSPEGLRLIGARARGKKHKHEGTNCDDWFHFDVSGGWTIIAVSDGAGSKRFSRVGARVACETAVAMLVKELKDHQLKKREDWAAGALNRDDAGTFPEADLESVQGALHAAMQGAYRALLDAAKERAESDAHKAVLNGRNLEPDDLSATLLLAVHTQVEDGEGRRSFVLTCQVGDGMLCAVDTRGKLTLLGEPDSGEFAGQTDFLTSKNKLDRDSLIRNTHGFIGSLQALMVMTDGVADDYYPSNPNLLRLYGDLVLNGIITLKGPDDSDISYDDINAALGQTKLKTLDDVAQSDFGSHVENIIDEQGNTRETLIRSSQSFAERLEVPLAEVVAQPALLLAGAQAGTIGDDCFGPHERLQRWIDSYHVRGSFDDRTLVVLYRESVA
jgi:Protein phosphatase 2C